MEIMYNITLKLIDSPGITSSMYGQPEKRRRNPITY